MNLQRKYGLPVLATIFLGGCATVSVPQSTGPQSSGLGIVMTLRAPIGIFSAKPDLVYFARIDNEDGILQQQIVRSNYAKDGRVYLLNARPGTYVAVAAFFRRTQVVGGPSTTYTTYFSKELLEQTRLNVKEGDFAFMGSYAVDQSAGLAEADAVQIHYANVIAPGAATSGLLNILSSEHHYRGTALEATKDEEVQGEFFRHAREDLADGGWEERFR